jgi:hypothetical protein
VFIPWFVTRFIFLFYATMKSGVKSFAGMRNRDIRESCPLYGEDSFRRQTRNLSRNMKERPAVDGAFAYSGTNHRRLDGIGHLFTDAHIPRA